MHGYYSSFESCEGSNKFGDCLYIGSGSTFSFLLNVFASSTYEKCFAIVGLFLEKGPFLSVAKLCNYKSKLSMAYLSYFNRCFNEMDMCFWRLTCNCVDCRNVSVTRMQKKGCTKNLGFQGQRFSLNFNLLLD